MQWDIGFQLSVLAMLGLLVYAPRLERWIGKSLEARTDPARARTLLYFFRDAFIVTAAAVLVTTPLIVLYFHRVSVVGFLTNFLVLPVQPPIMILGGAATLLQMLANALSAIPLLPLLIGALAQVVAWGAYVFLQYTILVVQATAAIPYGTFEVARVDAPLVILFYAALFGVTYLGIKRTGQLLVSRVWLGVALVALATIFVWTTALASPDPRTRISFIASGEGDATFIRTGDDYRILINGTGEPNTLLSYLGNQFPPWDRRLDLVVATHLDNDNLSSLNAVLERYDVGQVLEPNAPTRPGVSFEKWRGLIEEKGIAAHVAEEGMRLSAGEIAMEVVHGPKHERQTTNVVLRIEAEGKSLILAPKLTRDEQNELVDGAAGLDAEVAVLPNEVKEGWMERVTPETVILFEGRRPQDKPTGETLKLLEGVTVLRTDERGTIDYVLDGDVVSIQSAK